MDTIQAWSNEPESYRRGETYTEQIEFTDGQVVAVSLAPVILHNELLGTVSIFRDITHQVEVDRLKSEFVATVSHELRTPMTSIKGYVDIMLQGAAGELNEQQTKFLEVVKNNTERLNILVNDLLDVSHIEAGRVTLTKQPIDIQDIVERVVENVQRRAMADEKEIEFRIELVPDLPLVLADPDQVDKILSNLVDNAYNYTPQDGRVTVTVHTSAEELQIDIQDTGIGIHPDDQERVFERFYRGEDPLVLATAGTGLGLSIVNQMVEMHSGRLWLESSGVPGEGSTFSFTLPLYSPSLAGPDA
jgi:signal transduction histidine kinase